MAAPVAKNEEVELRIDSLAYGGNGVARLNGFVVFVRRALPGDTVRARVTKVKRGYAEATATEVLAPSPERIDAPCKHYYEGCGGCRFQDLRYEAQVAAKEAQVHDAFVRIGGIPEPPLEPILPAEEQFHYRNKLEYSFTETPKGAALGFHRAGLGARGGLAAVRPGGAARLPAPPRRARGAEHRAGARPARHRAGRSPRG